MLSDEEKRRKYDRHGDNWEHGDRIEREPAPAEAGETARQRRNGFTWRSNYMRSQPEIEVDFETEVDDEGLFDRLFRDLRNNVKSSPPVEYSADLTLEEAYRGAARVVGLADGDGWKSRCRRGWTTVPGFASPPSPVTPRRRGPG